MKASFLATIWGVLWCAQAMAGEVIVDFLDVGQGDGILIRGGGKNVLIDAGIKRARVADQLRALDVTRLDLVITTHPHADHMGGMEDVVRAFPVGLYIDNGLPHTTATYEALMVAIEELNIPYETGRTGLRLNLGEEAFLQVHLPGDTLLSDTRSDLNSNSVVVTLTHGDMDFLFTGDAEEPTEQLLMRANLPDVDVLKVAHHGSEHSNTASFLRTVQPEIAVISVGEGNRYGHPDQEALDRLAAVGAQVYRTDHSGHIRAISNGTTVELLELGNFTGITVEPETMRLPGPAGLGAVMGSPHGTPRVLPSADRPAPTATPATSEATGLSLSGVRANDAPITPVLTPRERRRLLKQQQREARAAAEE